MLIKSEECLFSLIAFQVSLICPCVAVAAWVQFVCGVGCPTSQTNRLQTKHPIALSFFAMWVLSWFGISLLPARVLYVFYGQALH